MQFFDYVESQGIGTLTIMREKALNALNEELLAELETVLDGLDFDTLRCLLIRGQGTRAFAAGADIAAMARLNSEQAQAFSAFGNRVMLKLQRLPVPTIAVVCGYALGGGCELALACDLRLCSDNAVFGQPETGLGILPGFGGTQRLSRLVGMGRAKQLIFSAANIDASEAFRIGLVNGVYPKEELFAQAEKLAARIAGNAPIAVRKAKESMERGCELDIEEAVETEAQLFSEVFGSRDQVEGLTAFLEKRPHRPYENR